MDLVYWKEFILKENFINYCKGRAIIILLHVLLHQ